MTKEQLKDYLLEQTEIGLYTQEEVDSMSDFELFDAYLNWNGIIGYTEDICEVVEALTDKTIEQ